jgi:hypothetical protein
MNEREGDDESGYEAAGRTTTTAPRQQITAVSRLARATGDRAAVDTSTGSMR